MVNPDKCSAMWLGRIREQPSFFMGSKMLGNTEEIKLLGVTLDKDLLYLSTLRT